MQPLPAFDLKRGRTEALRAQELAARASLEERSGRAFSDQEWASAKRALLEFARLLRNWDHSEKDGDGEARSW